MSSFESIPLDEESAPPTAKQRLPHSRYGIASFDLVVYATLVWYVFAFSFGTTAFFHIITNLCYPLAIFAAFILGVVGVFQPHTRRIYAVLGLLFSGLIIYVPMYFPAVASIIRSFVGLSNGCC